MVMNVLVFNCGSSSLKYRLVAMPGEVELAGGEAQRIGPKTAEPSRILHHADGRKRTVQVPMRSHREAFQEVMALLAAESCPAADAIGHRVVHGGALFTRPTVMDAEALRKLDAVKVLAPLHNPPAMELMQACMERYCGIPQVAVFDTAYHATIPEAARTYALPTALTHDYGIRKYGFHGTSHQYVAEEAAKMLGKSLSELNAVSCHLGSGGASLCAIVHGESVENTMGYSPLPGLVMSTRCGDLDPALIMNMLALKMGNGSEVERWLNQRSGVLGMSGFSGDIRDVCSEVGQAAPGHASPRSLHTIDVYVWRIKKYLGAYLTLVGRADAVIFTDTIGELVPPVRQWVTEGLDVFGVNIDPEKNLASAELPVDIAVAGADLRVLVIATNEELAIARRAYEALVGVSALHLQPASCP
jgi:acetate kinase